jgi:hypothetical protein
MLFFRRNHETNVEYFIRPLNPVPTWIRVLLPNMPTSHVTRAVIKADGSSLLTFLRKRVTPYSPISIHHVHNAKGVW